WTRSLARISAKCRPSGLIRNSRPSSDVATLKWLAVASCMSSRAVQRNAQASSWRATRLSCRTLVAVFPSVIAILRVVGSELDPAGLLGHVFVHAVHGVIAADAGLLGAAERRLVADRVD